VPAYFNDLRGGMANTIYIIGVSEGRTGLNILIQQQTLLRLLLRNKKRL